MLLVHMDEILSHGSTLWISNHIPPGQVHWSWKSTMHNQHVARMTVVKHQSELQAYSRDQGVNIKKFI